MSSLPLPTATTTIGKLIEETIEITTMVGRGTLRTLADALVATETLKGDVVELGCFQGYTTRFMCQVMQMLGRQRKVHVYDSFDGLPEPEPIDHRAEIPFNRGSCKTSYEDFVATFEGSPFKMPEMHAGWFEDTLPQELPKKISLAFLDSDLYESMRISIESVLPRMVSGGYIVMHDFIVCPGSKKAIEEFREHYAWSTNYDNVFIAQIL